MKAAHVLRVFVVVVLLSGVLRVSGQPCPASCFAPDCSCPRFSHTMDTREIPQIVYFGFDDAVNTVMSSLYRRIFTKNRVNPNGCKMKMTLFVSHQYTDYRLVKRFYDDGNEIGVHSVTHTAIDDDDKLRREAKDQKDNIARVGVPLEEIKGWRSPFLKPAGNNQPQILKDLGYDYDISLTYSRFRLSQPKPWPFTMDNGWPYRCGVPPCPTSASVEKFWEVPVVSLMDYKNQYPCSFVDGCAIRATSENEAYNFLMNNFLSYYNTTRTPFGLNMHAAWFYTRYNLKAMMRFLDTLMTMKDVYVVTVSQMLDWMRNPTPLSEIHMFRPWQCPESTRLAAKMTKAPSTASTSRPTKTTTSTTSTTTTSRPTTTTTIPTTTTTTQKPTTTTTTQKPTTTTTTPKPTTTKTTTTTTPIPTTTSTTTTPKPTTATPKPTTTTTTASTTTTTTQQTTTTTTPQPTTTTPRPTTATPSTTSTPQTQPTTKEQPSREVIKPSPASRFQRTRNTPRIPPTRGGGNPFQESPTKPTEASMKAIKTPVPIANISVSRPVFRPRLQTGMTTKGRLWDIWTATTEVDMPITRNTECLQGHNCKLPDCFCQSTDVPNNLRAEDIPQMVYITIDGNLNPAVFRRYRQLFKGRKNPNGCRSKGTVFATDRGSYAFVMRRLAMHGAEIAMQGVHEHHYETAAHMEEEIVQQKKSLATAGISNITGWKTPELKALGNEQFRLLKDFGFKYDATLSASIPKEGQLNPWPFTLDFGFKGKCVIPECPTDRFPGLWEIPTVAVKDYRQMFECGYIDGCMFNPPSSNDTEYFLLQNFMFNYRTNRAPFGLHLRQVWFSHPAYLKNIDGLLRFLDRIQNMSDVYLVSAEDVLTWIKKPTVLGSINKDTPWKCS